MNQVAVIVVVVVVVYSRINICHLDSFRVFLIKRSNVEGVGSINLSTRRYQWWRIFLLVDLAPVHVSEERMFLQLNSSVQPPVSTVNL